MNCKKVERLLTGYLDNSLKTAKGDKVETHLAGCGKCRDYLNAMAKIDNLIKLKVKEKPSKEYFENYWPRLESKLGRAMAPRLSENRRWPNLFIPRLSPAFSGILIALLILVNSFLYINIRELTSSMIAINEGQARVQKEMSRYAEHLRIRLNAKGNVQILVPFENKINTKGNIEKLDTLKKGVV